MDSKIKGAWLIHHTNKLEKFNQHVGLDDIHIAGKCGKLLSAISESEREADVSNLKIRVLADSCGINKLEQESILSKLQDEFLIDKDSKGNVRTLGITQSAILQKTAEIFDSCNPSKKEIASLDVSEFVSNKPTSESTAKEYISDTFQMSKYDTETLFLDIEKVNIIDSELVDKEKLLFNGNLFKKEGLRKTKAVIDSLSSLEQQKIIELNELIDRNGCISVEDAHKIIGKSLFQKLHAISMYEVNSIANSSETKLFITKTISFSKFGNPMVDDALDSAKALVTSLVYGMLHSDQKRGKITMINYLLDKLLSGNDIGPAPAIGEDYKALELKGVVKITPEPTRPTHFYMRLLKKDVGQLAKEVLLNGGTSGTILLSNLNSCATIYESPEKVRESLRQRANITEEKRDIGEKLRILRTLK